MRSIHQFNQDWLYAADKLTEDTADNAFHPVTLPHTNIVLPYHNFDDAEYQFVSTYRKRFTLPEALDGRRLYLDFEGAMIAATVTLNGHTFPEHRGGYTPFSLDITPYINEDGENLLTVHLDSTERKDIPPFGFVVDYLTFGGIYRDVTLRYVGPVYVRNINVWTEDVLSDAPKTLVDIYIQNQGEEDAEFTILCEVENADFNPAVQSQIVPSEDISIVNLSPTQKLPVELWHPDNPVLYVMRVSLLDKISGAVIDSYRTRYGYREAEFRDDGFYLNGELFHLRGLNRHQTYPYIGAAAPAKLQEHDADTVKFDLGCNVVRTSHYPQSPYFLDRCDEIGLLVFEEIPGWQHIGDEDWQSLSLRDVRKMIERDWNHPSIILWGVRINESLDSQEFYRQSNALAHELDPTRQTGGVRNFTGSTMLEDVYTYNDFSNGIIEPLETPWLVTEFNGHMFPTKSFDGEERRVEHALRHARVQSAAVQMGGVSGAIGWCAFDYNTHTEFGSGDRICYHGVMDIFRQPKYAADFYGSQISPVQRVVLKAATGWTMGDRSEGGNDPLVVFSNCERIGVYIGEDHLGDYEPDATNYPGLPHPPFTVTDVPHRWGEGFQPLRVVGYLNDEVAAEQRIAADGVPHHLVLETAHDVLTADGADMTWLWVRIVDEYENPLPYAISVVSFMLEGPGELIGTNPFPLVGGQAGLFVKSTHESGTIIIRAMADRLAPVEIQIRAE